MAAVADRIQILTDGGSIAVTLDGPHQRVRRLRRGLRIRLERDADPLIVVPIARRVGR